MKMVALLVRPVAHDPGHRKAEHAVRRLDFDRIVHVQVRHGAEVVGDDHALPCRSQAVHLLLVALEGTTPRAPGPTPNLERHDEHRPATKDDAVAPHHLDGGNAGDPLRAHHPWTPESGSSCW